MDFDYWHKQQDKACFPDLEWSRPETKLQSGKMLIIGGNQHEFIAPAQAYSFAEQAGIGYSRVLLPSSVKPQLRKLPSNLEVEYTTSTPSGSLAVSSLADMISLSSWADGVLLAGSLGHNSETAILLEKYIGKYSGILMLTKDAVDYFVQSPNEIVNRPNTCLALTMAQLQKIGNKLDQPMIFKFDSNILEIVRTLHDFSSRYQTAIILKHLNILYVAYGGQVSTTKLDPDPDSWRLEAASRAVVWWIQNPSKVFEALTTAVYQQFDSD